MLLIGGCANGYMARLVEAATSSGFSSLTLGLSPFELIAVLAGARLLLRGSQRPPRLGWAEAATLALVLVPSSAVSWVGVAFYALVHAARSDGDQWRGAMLFLGLAMCALWSSVALKWLAMPVTTAEATIVGWVAGWLRPDIVQAGNVIGNPANHSLILMTACTSSDGAPPAILALVSVAHFLGGIDRTRAIHACGVMLAFYGMTNLARLVGMTWSADAYTVLHGPIGSNGFDALQTGAVLVLGNWASRT